MSQTVITTAFEQWKAQQAVNGGAVALDEFVFANVPDLDTDAPIDRAEGLPDKAQIVHRQAVSRTGVVNENAVVYSVVLGAETGDFSFNWIGLMNKASGTLAMIVHAPLQQKIKTTAGQQGNVLTRSFLMEFNGAQTETAISMPAETWQIDFTARMMGMDERQRLENIDIYGPGAFFGNGWLVGKTGTQYFVTKGAGYVAGLRAELATNQNITVTTKPVKVWLDVCWRGTLTSAWTVEQKVTVAASLSDYEQNGVKHYVFALASIDENGVITDLRPKGALSEQQASSDYMRKDKNLQDVANIPAARKVLDVYSKAEAVPATRKINGKALSGDITISATDAAAIPDGGNLGTININTLTGTKFGRYVQPVSANATEANGYPPQAGVAGALDVIQNAANGFEGCTQEFRPYNSNVCYRRFYNAANKSWSAWLFDISSAGGQVTGELMINNPGLALRLIAPKGRGVYIQARDTDNNPRWYIGAGSDNNDGCAFQNYKYDTNIVLSSVITCNKSVNISGAVTPTSYVNFDARYQAKGNYTPAGQAYTKAESDARYNLKNSISIKTASRLVTKDSTTGVMEVVMSGISVGNRVNANVTFPVAFPNACAGVVISYNGAGHGNDSDSAIYVPSYSKTGCILYANNANGIFTLIAKGY
ncbi:phage tail protein [Pantoea sp. FN0305]|uniref:phage tail-collar fiber domain-containing protein n=1 Tax=Pantoea sp. FN0305 TaxID=3418559 RepID=UPI003CE72AA3